ncbi:protein C8orf37-like [Protopterus annectens]|uniref:protein C8orf37-like n=1 Tax=Protopterus annectens TaxID=7888 RepID=UPI001CFB2128|nr:protein C8orf37-like [Protopterus annectens]
MADDLDSLLDEVESKFCNTVSVKTSMAGGSRQVGSNAESRGASKKTTVVRSSRAQFNSEGRRVEDDDDDIDEFLDDILSENSLMGHEFDARCNMNNPNKILADRDLRTRQKGSRKNQGFF